jgi:EpsG family
MSIYKEEFLLGRRDVQRSKATLLAIAAGILVVRILTAPEQFADFNGYVVLLDEIVFGKWSVWIYGDPFSWGLLSLFRDYSGDSYSAIKLGNIYLSLIYILLMYWGVIYYRIPWQAVLLISAVFGPILAFVTIRATPAYFFVMFAALEASRGNRRAFTLVIAAALFHSSALLALPPLIASFAQTRFTLVDSAFRSRTTAVLLGLIIIVPFAIFRNSMIEVTRGALDFLGSAFSRFSIYVKDGQNTIDSQNGGSIFQQIYFVLSSIALLFFISTAGKLVRGLQGYLITSFGIFVFMSGDPPSAFRQSLFWMMPLMVAFPWQNISLRGLSTWALIPLAIVLFWYGFSEVII